MATVSGRFYLHFPLTMGIAAVGSAGLNVVESAGESLPAEVRWLLVSAIAMALIGTERHYPITALYDIL